jgi:hypothetical protein
MRLELERTETRGRPFPYLIQTFLQRIEWLHTDRSLFPELGARKRSERIEAMILVAKAMARNFDRLTQRCGRPMPDGTFAGITVVTMGRWGRMQVSERQGRKVCQRASRALWDLRDAGFVELVQPIETRPDGARRGLAGIRRIARKLFERLELGGRLKRDQRELSDAKRKAATAETIAERRRLRRLFRENRRAGLLAKRATYQLAERAADAPRPKQFTTAELAEQLAAWRARQP